MHVIACNAIYYIVLQFHYMSLHRGGFADDGHAGRSPGGPIIESGPDPSQAAVAAGAPPARAAEPAVGWQGRGAPDPARAGLVTVTHAGVAMIRLGHDRPGSRGAAALSRSLPPTFQLEVPRLAAV